MLLVVKTKEAVVRDWVGLYHWSWAAMQLRPRSDMAAEAACRFLRTDRSEGALPVVLTNFVNSQICCVHKLRELTNLTNPLFCPNPTPVKAQNRFRTPCESW